MTNRLTIGQWTASAFISGAVLLGLVPLTFFALSQGGLQTLRFDQTIFSVLWFTLKQAFLSAAISTILGLWAARALARREFVGKYMLLNVMAVPFALPAIVAVLAITTVYGNQGWLSGIFNIYGLTGILLVHVFFNFSLAAKLVHQALSDIEPLRFRLGAQLGFSDHDVFWHIEWPVLRSVLPRVFSLIFLLCAASFVVVLTLGGPGATSLEVAIYQSLRMDFDVGRALSLSILQIILCFVFVTFAGRTAFAEMGLGQAKNWSTRFDGRSVLAKLSDGGAIVLALVILLPPISAMIGSGLLHIKLDRQILEAALTSMVIGSGAATLALSLAWPIAKLQHWAAQGLSLAGLIVPPAVLATGWFLALRSYNSGLLIPLCSIITLNGLMALPFSVSIFRGGFSRMGASHDRLCMQLGLRGWNRFWRIDMPFMVPALRQAGLLAFVMSLGDLTAVTLLGSHGIITLPALIHSEMGNYRSHAAAGTALFLAVVCYALASIAQRTGKAT